MSASCNFQRMETLKDAPIHEIIGLVGARGVRVDYRPPPEKPLASVIFEDWRFKNGPLHANPLTVWFEVS